MKVWITRDITENEDACGIFWGNTRPKFFEVTNAYSIADLNMSIKKFAKRFKFAPEKGSCQQYELTLTKVKEQ